MRNINLQILITTLTLLFFVSLIHAQSDDGHRPYITKLRQQNAQEAILEQAEKSKSPASISVDANASPCELIAEKFISGGCFDVANITYSGASNALGEFANGGTSIGIEDGIILSTGKIDNILGPNTSNARSTSHNDMCNDFDLLTLANGATNRIWDCASLEFDFTPTTDMVSFEYAFASEEYCEFAGDEYNDVFGFFISGPGINGQFANNAENLAVLPGSNAAVSINSVNHFVNETYYVPNERQINANSCFKPFEAVALNDIEFDGFTQVLTATAQVIPCQTYHIRLAIGDGEDAIYDSAVFLKANSFNAGGSAVASAFSNITTSNLVYETCDDAFFLFERTSDDLEEPTTINFTIDPSSTATEGLDFDYLPEFITIPAGEMEYFMPVHILSDNLLEGAESLVLEIDNSCSCSVSNTELIINEAPQISLSELTLDLCENESFSINPVSYDGTLQLTYEWSDGTSTSSFESIATSSTDYGLTVTDQCGQSVETLYTVNVASAPLAEIGGNHVLCNETEETMIRIDLEGTSPWNIIYSIDGNPQNPIQITDSPYELAATTAGIYTLESVDSYACFGEAKGTAIVQQSNFESSYLTQAANCYNEGLGNIEIQTTGTTGPFTYEWNTTFGNTPNPQAVLANTYMVTITDALDCPQTETITVENHIAYPEGTIEETAEITCSNTTTELNGSIATSEDNNTFLWSTPDGNILSGVNSFSAMVDQGGLYTLTISNTENGCSTDLTTTVVENIASPQAEAIVMGTLTCVQLETELEVNVLGAENMEYMWTTTSGNILSGTESSNPTVDSPGMYEVLITNLDNDCTTSSTIEVAQNLDQPIVAVGEDQELTCTINELDLQGMVQSNGISNSVWQKNGITIPNSQNDLSIPVAETGTYTLVVTNQENGCSAQDELIVIENTNYPSSLQTQSVIPTCKGDMGSVTISGVEGGESPYLFSIDGGNSFFSESDFHELQAGSYDLIVQDVNGCELENTFVLPDGNEPSLDLQTTVELRLGENHQIQPQLNILPSQIQSVQWFPTQGLTCSDCLNPMVEPTKNIQYRLTIIDENGCSASGDIAFRVEVQKNIYIPNAFSPHQIDGANDIFQLYAQKNLVSQIITMKIFDRWGNNLYQANNFEPNSRTGWDGTSRSKNLKPGVYVYYFEIELINGTILTYSGDVTLMD